jgi:predicted DNA-binding transcriptional regulator YafY
MASETQDDMETRPVATGSERDLSRNARQIYEWFNRGEELSYAEMVERLGLSQKQVGRAIEELRQHDIPVESIGRIKIFFIPEDSRRAPYRVVELSEEEIVALTFAARASESVLEPTPLSGPLASAFDSLLRTLSEQPISFDVESQRRQWHFGGAHSVPLRGEVFRTLWHAILNRQSVTIDYFSARENRQTADRKVDPYTLAVRAGSWMLVGYCHRERKVREFSLPDISGAGLCDPETDARAFFEIRDGFDIEAHFRNRFNAVDGEIQVVRLLVEPDRARYFKRKIYHGTQRIEEEHSDGSIVVRYEIGGLEDIRSWVQSWGTGVTVLEPEALRTIIREQAEEVARRYGRGER